MRCSVDKCAVLGIVLLGAPSLAHARPRPEHAGVVPAAPLVASEAPTPTAPGDVPPDAANTTDLARELFRRGSSLAFENQWSRALAAYEESYRLFPHAETRFNIGVCYDHLGQPARAGYEIARALAGVHLEPHLQLSAERQRQAAAQLELVEQGLTRIELSNSPAGLRLLVDGRELVEADSLGDLRVPANPDDEVDSAWAPYHVLLLEPGKHVIRLVLQSDHQERSIVAQPGERVVLSWDPARPKVLPTAPTEAMALVRSSAKAPPPAAKPPTDAGSSWSGWIPTVAWSFVGVSALTAGVGGLWTLSTHEKLESRCPQGACGEQDRALVGQYESAVALTNAGLWATASGLVITLGYLTLSGEDEGEATKIQVSSRGVTLLQNF